jgi:hypothetical protein
MGKPKLFFYENKCNAFAQRGQDSKVSKIPSFSLLSLRLFPPLLCMFSYSSK